MSPGQLVKTLLGMAAKLINKSVFRRMPKGTAMNDMLAILFHRAAATIYLFYVGWGILQTWQGMPSLVRSNGQDWNTLFAVFIIATCAPACFGATFWPTFARLELIAGSSVVALLLVYMYFLTVSVIQGEASWSGWELLLSILVIPVCRTLAVVVFLMRQAENDRIARTEAILRLQGKDYVRNSA